MFWRKLAINIHLTAQLLFILGTINDFFLMILAHSARSHIFDLVPSLAIFIISPWIITIFVLSVSLVISILTEDKVVVKRDIFGYIVMAIIYAILLTLSLFNPVIVWPVMLSYIVYMSWAGSLAYFKLAIIKGK